MSDLIESCLSYIWHGDEKYGVFSKVGEDFKVVPLVKRTEDQDDADLCNGNSNEAMRVIPELVLDCSSCPLWIPSTVSKRNIFVVNEIWWDFHTNKDAFLVYREGMEDVYRINSQLSWDNERQLVRRVAISENAFPASHAVPETPSHWSVLIKKEDRLHRTHCQYLFRYKLNVLISRTLKATTNRAQRQSFSFSVAPEIVQVLFSWRGIQEDWISMNDSRAHKKSHYVQNELFTVDSLPRHEIVLKLLKTAPLSGLIGNNYFWIPLARAGFLGRDFSGMKIASICANAKNPLQFSYDYRTHDLTVSFAIKHVVCGTPMFSPTDEDNEDDKDDEDDDPRSEEVAEQSNFSGLPLFNSQDTDISEGKVYRTTNSQLFTIAHIENVSGNKRKRNCYLTFYEPGCCWYEEPELLQDVASDKNNARSYCKKKKEDAVRKLLAAADELDDAAAIEAIETVCNPSAAECAIACNASLKTTRRTSVSNVLPSHVHAAKKCEELIGECNNIIAGTILEEMIHELRRQSGAIDVLSRLTRHLDHPSYSNDRIEAALLLLIRSNPDVRGEIQQLRSVTRRSIYIENICECFLRWFKNEYDVAF